MPDCSALICIYETQANSSFDWFTIVQTVGIIAGIIFSGWALWRSAESQKAQNYLLLTQYHRDVWRMTLESDGLNRVRTRNISQKDLRLTDEERQFLTFVVLHITGAYELSKHNLMIKNERDAYDIGEFMSLPLPNLFWNDAKRYYNKDFVEYVDECISKHRSNEKANMKTKIAPNIEINPPATSKKINKTKA